MEPTVSTEPFPDLPLEAWRDTKETLHRFAQVVGKIRLAASPRRNHWWNVPFHVTGRGTTTRPMIDPGSGHIFTIDFDFVAHCLRVQALTGEEIVLPLAGRSVARFHDDTLNALRQLGVTARPHLDHPFDLPDAQRPFTEDTDHRAYDTAAVNTYWRVLSRVSLELEAFASGYAGKISPVHHFWHTFDIAVTRFSDRRVPQSPATDPVTREAYSREVISSGFWFGDEDFPQPAFYSYTAPEPAGLAEQPLEPAQAFWHEKAGSHLAVLPYAQVRTARDPHLTIQAFFASAYRAGAELAGWPHDLECSVGVTDPVVAHAS